MKKFIFLLLFLLYSFLSFSQDIVYDSIVGNPENWRRIKIGQSETILNTFYENTGIICESKLLLVEASGMILQKALITNYIDSHQLIRYHLNIKVREL